MFFDRHGLTWCSSASAVLSCQGGGDSDELYWCVRACVRVRLSPVRLCWSCCLFVLIVRSCSSFVWSFRSGFCMRRFHPSIPSHPLELASSLPVSLPPSSRLIPPCWSKEIAIHIFDSFPICFRTVESSGVWSAHVFVSHPNVLFPSWIYQLLIGRCNQKVRSTRSSIQPSRNDACSLG
jgi:hypothetical protein